MIRKDAQRNRAHLLETADRLLAARGVGITLNELAAAAGAGVATVYRHFATLDEVLDALIPPRLARAAQVLLDAERVADDVAALRHAVEATCALQQADRALWDILQAAGPRYGAEYRRRFQPVLRRLVGRARASGRVRKDFDETDLMLIFWIGGAVGSLTAGIRAEVAQRYVGALLDGFLLCEDRAGNVVEPLTAVELRRAMKRGRI